MTENSNDSCDDIDHLDFVPGFASDEAIETEQLIVEEANKQFKQDVFATPFVKTVLDVNLAMPPNNDIMRLLYPSVDRHIDAFDILPLVKPINGGSNGAECGIYFIQGPCCGMMPIFTEQKDSGGTIHITTNPDFRQLTCKVIEAYDLTAEQLADAVGLEPDDYIVKRILIGITLQIHSSIINMTRYCASHGVSLYYTDNGILMSEAEAARG